MSQSQKPNRNRALVRTSLALATTLFPLQVFAQAEAPAQPPVAAPAETPAPPAEPPAAPLPPAAPPVTVAPVVAPTPTVNAGGEPTIAASATPPPDGSEKPLEVNVWGRLGNNIVSPKNKDADTSVDAEVDLLMGGKIQKYVGWTADFVATYGPNSGGMTGSAQILDLIAKFDLVDPLHVWFGRMLVPSDRSNFSGAWFMAPWTYPGGYVSGAPPIGPRQGPNGRNDGATVWGQVGGGIFKYYAGVYDLHDPATSPLYSGRVNLSLINPEPGYYHSSTYYGAKDILAIGLSAQYKKNGSVAASSTVVGAPMPAADDYTGFSADLLFEKTFGGAGSLDVEGTYYNFQGNNEAIKSAYYGLASYLIPVELGIGKLQPLFRFQQAFPKADNAKSWKIMDAQLGYAIKEYAARLALGYERIDLGLSTTVSNAFFLGIQLQK